VTFSIKGYRGHRTSDGEAFVCTLCENGKPVAYVEQSGTGGDTRFDFRERDAQARFDQAVQQAPPLTYPDGSTLPMCRDIYIEDLIEAQRFDRLAGKNTLFRSGKVNAIGMREVYRYKGVLDEAQQQAVRRRETQLTDVWVRGLGWRALAGEGSSSP